MNDTPNAAVPPAVVELLRNLRSTDDVARGAAWQNAGPLGAAAVDALIQTMSDPDRETARAAQRALWSVVHHAGRPGADSERAAVATRLAAVFERPDPSVAVRRDVIWMLSAIGSDASVEALAARLKEAELREDARCALQRIPGSKSLAALQAALTDARDDFAAALADALRARGETVPGHPSRRLVPTRLTTIGA